MDTHTNGLVPEAIPVMPYVGPRPFGREDGHLFFGRERERHELADLWQSNRLTILHGPSGSGKTSLLRAGVLPLLDPAKTSLLPIGRVSRGMASPAAILPDGGNPQVFALLSSWAPYTPPAGLADSTVADFLRQLPKRTDPYGDPLLTMLAIDHMEDLFGDVARRRTHCEGFLRQLAAALEASPHARLLVVISDDGLASILRYDDRLTVMAKARFRLGPLTPQAALDACRGPLEGSGRSFAPGAAEALVTELRTVRRRVVPEREPSAEAGEPGEVREVRDTVEPVQLQLVCAALWRSLPPGRDVITLDDVRATDADQTLSGFCDRVIEEVARAHYDGQAGKLRLRLRQIFISDGGTRETAYRGVTETAGLPNTVIRALADRHLLRIEEDLVGGWVELSHDRLIQPLLHGGGTEGREAEPGLADHLRAAEIALSDGQFALAAKHAEEALRHCGTDTRRRAETESFLGNIHYLAGDAREAIAHYRTSVQLFASLRGTEAAVATLLAAIGQARIHQGDVTSALRELGSAVRQNPSDLGIQVKLAWAMWYSGRPAAALDVLDNVLDLKGDLTDARRARGEMRADLGDAPQALRDLQRAHPHQLPGARAAWALALALAGSVPEALHALPPDKDEQDAAVLLRVARVLAAADRPADAADLAARAVRATRPPLPPHLKVTAIRLADEGRAGRS
jgi:tetratricopeptide (TPR) repeat protein